jgi:hypothetical protein
MKTDRKKWLDALGKRVIVRENAYSPLIEAKIKEVSERYVKLHFVESGVNKWYDYDTYKLCETLPERYEGVPIAPSTPHFENEMYKEIERRMIENELAKKPILWNLQSGGIMNCGSGNSLRHDFK